MVPLNKRKKHRIKYGHKMDKGEKIHVYAGNKKG